jgi:hypothetical protein
MGALKPASEWDVVFAVMCFESGAGKGLFDGF